MVEVDKSEEITINRGRVDLRQVFSSARASNQPNTDFIRTAIQRQMESRAAAVNDTVARRS